MILPLKEYEKRKIKYNSLLKKQQKFGHNITNLRLAVFILGLITLIITYIFKKYILFDSIVAGVIVLLFYLAYLHKNISEFLFTQLRII